MASVLFLIVLTWPIPFIGGIVQDWPRMSALERVALLAWCGTLVGALILKRFQFAKGLLVGLGACVVIGLLGFGGLLLVWRP